MKTYNERTQSIKNKVKAKRDRRLVIWTASSVACALLVLTVVCSLPILGTGVPNINAYKNDEYYPLIKKINSQIGDNKYSIFDKLSQGFGSKDDGNVFEPSSPDVSEGDNSSSSGNKYEETTLNQVDGIVESDLLKRSSTHAFYLKNGYSKNEDPCLLLQIYRLDGADTEKVTEYFIRPKDGTSFCKYSAYIDGEMFLSDDASRITVIATCISEQNIVYTTVISLDVTDVSNVTEVNRVYVSGEYLSSRKTDGSLLVITNFNAGHYGYYGYNAIDYDEKQTYIPQCGSDLNGAFIPIENIHIPDNCQQTNYTVLALLDETSLSVVDSHAVFSYTQDVYVSQDYIVVMRNNYYCYKNQFEYGHETESSSNADFNAYVCEIVALKYKDGFEFKGETGLDGFVKDRYSMDEKDGVLRVFVTVRHSKYTATSPSVINVSLYCVNLENMQTVASKERFAPSGDEVKSARFDGNKAYVCTARLNTDPVFCFDLIDLNNISFVDTGEIDGFSVNLIKFNGLLLGIGQGADNGILNVELYKETDDNSAENGIVSIAKFKRICRFSYEYKAHFVNADNNLIGLQIYDMQDDLITSNPNAIKNKYLLLKYDAQNCELQQVYLDEFDSHTDYTRAFYKDNGVYVFGTSGFLFIEV